MNNNKISSNDNVLKVVSARVAKAEYCATEDVYQIDRFKLPAIQSLSGAALAMMLQGKKISHLDFMSDTRSYCLRHPIYKLRLAGWTILDEVIPGGIAKYSGRRTHYKIYFIDQVNLILLKKESGERLDSFVAALDDFEQRIRDEH